MATIDVRSVHGDYRVLAGSGLLSDLTEILSREDLAVPASLVTDDVVAPLYENEHRKLSSRARIALTRMFIVTIGLYVLGWGLIYHGSDDVFDYMAVTGAVYFSGAFALLLGGLYWKRASSTGAILAILAGMLAILGLSPVQHGIGWTLNALAGSSAEWIDWLAPIQ